MGQTSRTTARLPIHPSFIIFIVTYVGYLLLYSTRKPFSIVKATFQRDFGMSTSALGFIDSSFLSAYALGQLTLPGRIAILGGDRFCLVASFAGSCVAAMVFSMSSHLAAFVVAWFFNGLLHSIVYPLMVRSLSNSLPPKSSTRRGQLLGLWTTSQQVGSLSATAMATALVRWQGWRVTFFISGVIVGLYSFVLLMILPRSPALTSITNIDDNENRINFVGKAKTGSSAKPVPPDEEDDGTTRDYGSNGSSPEAHHINFVQKNITNRSSREHLNDNAIVTSATPELAPHEAHVSIVNIHSRVDDMSINCGNAAGGHLPLSNQEALFYEINDRASSKTGEVIPREGTTTDGDHRADFVDSGSLELHVRGGMQSRLCQRRSPITPLMIEKHQTYSNDIPHYPLSNNPEYCCSHTSNPAIRFTPMRMTTPMTARKDTNSLPQKIDNTDNEKSDFDDASGRCHRSSTQQHSFRYRHTVDDEIPNSADITTSGFRHHHHGIVSRLSLHGGVATAASILSRIARSDSHTNSSSIRNHNQSLAGALCSRSHGRVDSSRRLEYCCQHNGDVDNTVGRKYEADFRSGREGDIRKSPVDRHCEGSEHSGNRNSRLVSASKNRHHLDNDVGSIFHSVIQNPTETPSQAQNTNSCESNTSQTATLHQRRLCPTMAAHSLTSIPNLYTNFPIPLSATFMDPDPPPLFPLVTSSQLSVAALDPFPQPKSPDPLQTSLTSQHHHHHHHHRHHRRHRSHGPHISITDSTECGTMQYVDHSTKMGLISPLVNQCGDPSCQSVDGPAASTERQIEESSQRTRHVRSRTSPCTSDRGSATILSMQCNLPTNQDGRQQCCHRRCISMSSATPTERHGVNSNVSNGRSSSSIQGCDHQLNNKCRPVVDPIRVEIDDNLGSDAHFSSGKYERDIPDSEPLRAISSRDEDNGHQRSGALYGGDPQSCFTETIGGRSPLPAMNGESLLPDRRLADTKIEACDSTSSSCCCESFQNPLLQPLATPAPLPLAPAEIIKAVNVICHNRVQHSGEAEARAEIGGSKTVAEYQNVGDLIHDSGSVYYSVEREGVIEGREAAVQEGRIEAELRFNKPSKMVSPVAASAPSKMGPKQADHDYNGRSSMCLSGVDGECLASPSGSSDSSSSASSVSRSSRSSSDSGVSRRQSDIKMKSGAEDENAGIHRHARFRDVLWAPDVMTVAVAFFCVKSVRYAMLSWTPYYLAAALKYNDETAGYSSMLFDIGGILGSVGTGIVSDRFLHGRRFLAAMIMTLFMGISLPLFHWSAQRSFLGAVISLLFVGYAVAGPDSILGAAGAHDISERAQLGFVGFGIATGIINGTGSLGAVLQGFIAAGLSEALGWGGLFLCLMAASFVSTAFLFLPALHEHRHLNKVSGKVR